MNCLGIGPKVADCFLLYGLGFKEATPVDIWIQRIASHFYFQNSKVNNEDIGTILRRQYQSDAGLAQLYLYHFSRRYMS
jgi:N-glycosylase/DNA lyase